MCMKEKGRVTQMKTAKKKEKNISLHWFSIWIVIMMGIFSLSNPFSHPLSLLFLFCVADLCSFPGELNHLKNFKLKNF